MIRLILLSLLTLFGATGWLATPASAHAPHRFVIRGQIEAVDEAAGTFTVDTLHRGSITVAVGVHSHIRLDGGPSTLADLAAGQKVRVVGRPDHQNQVFRGHIVLART